MFARSCKRGINLAVESHRRRRCELPIKIGGIWRAVYSMCAGQVYSRPDGDAMRSLRLARGGRRCSYRAPVCRRSRALTGNDVITSTTAGNQFVVPGQRQPRCVDAGTLRHGGNGEDRHGGQDGAGDVRIAVFAVPRRLRRSHLHVGQFSILAHHHRRRTLQVYYDQSPPQILITMKFHCLSLRHTLLSVSGRPIMRYCQTTGWLKMRTWNSRTRNWRTRKWYCMKVGYHNAMCSVHFCENNVRTQVGAAK